MTSLLSAVATIFLAMFFAVSEGFGSSSTIAVIQSSETICGVRTGTARGKISCGRIGHPALAIAPNLTFEIISGGQDFFCGLSYGGLSIFCWTITNYSSGLVSTRRVYDGPLAMADLSVGGNQICALEKNRSRVRCWGDSASFPATVDGEFRSLTSGRGFSCAIGIDSLVQCWGGRGEEFQNAFSNITMQSIVAGDSHVCGIDLPGFLICKGNNSTSELDVPFGDAMAFSGLALGTNHSCAITEPTGTVFCWGGPAAGVWSYFPENSTDFEIIVASGDLTCGLITDNFTVMCWKADNLSYSFFVVHLPQILPGRCTKQGFSCKCGIFPNSESLCSDSDVICKSCGAPFISQQLPPPPSLPTSPPMEFPATSSFTSKVWLAFGIIGSVGAIAAICSIIRCIWGIATRNKKVHNYLKPSIFTGVNVELNSVESSISIPTNLASPPGSKSNVIQRHSSRAISSRRRRLTSFKEAAEEYSLADLAAATKNFSLDCRIGVGSFGTVYKGKLSRREVAIKRGEFKASSRSKKIQEKERAFQCELAFLSRLHHKHLVGLVGYCEERDERLLVYEYMKNGALYDHLHSRTRVSDSGKMNSWRMRIKVLLDAARGIEYLHNYAVPPVIHRDIKSSNILLDEEWVARVSDFGLSLLEPEAEDGNQSTRAAGTIGYMDPEYYGGMQHLTTKSDVYGFGVVMLEMITGRRAIFREDEADSGEPISVVDYAAARIDDGEAWQVLDSRVQMPEQREAEAVELVGYTAVHCVSMEGKDRPTITDVVMNLESALALCDTKQGSWSGSSMSFSSRD